MHSSVEAVIDTIVHNRARYTHDKINARFITRTNGDRKRDEMIKPI